jgi:hypothetical protein
MRMEGSCVHTEVSNLCQEDFFALVQSSDFALWSGILYI